MSTAPSAESHTTLEIHEAVHDTITPSPSSPTAINPPTDSESSTGTFSPLAAFFGLRASSLDASTTYASSTSGTKAVLSQTPSPLSFPPASSTPPARPFSKSIFQPKGDPQVDIARKIYLRVFLSGMIMVVLAIFAVFPIYWGSLWKVPANQLDTWVVDFDGGRVGNFFSSAVLASSNHAIRWQSVPPEQFGGDPGRVVADILNNKAWMAIVIYPDASTRLNNALVAPDPFYNASDAIIAYGIEARNENAYRAFLRPNVQNMLERTKLDFAIQFGAQLTSGVDLGAIMATSPQTIVNPISYTLVNLIPFNQPVASAVTFVGLIYLLILSFFLVMIASGARDASRVETFLSLRSLVSLRLISSFFGYFVISLFYSLMNKAFQLDLTRRFGPGGFMAFWILNYVGMLSVGLALEAMITILTPRYIPFFMILWIIANVSVCIFPIATLPKIYHYGYAAPFYNVSNSIRSIAFGTKNTLGLNFGILLVWVIVSVFSLSGLQWYVRNQSEKERMAAAAGTAGEQQGNPLVVAKDDSVGYEKANP